MQVQPLTSTTQPTVRHDPAPDPRRRPAATLLVAALLATSGGASALAQSQDVQRLQRLEQQMRDRDVENRMNARLGQKISERAIIDVGVIGRAGLFVIDDSFSESHTLRQYEASVFLRADFDGAHRFFGRLRFQYDDWNSGDSFDGDGDDFNDPVVDRAFYEFDYRGLIEAQGSSSPDFNLNLRAGRQYIQWNSGLTLSAPLDAGQLTLEFGEFTFTAIGGRTSTRDLIDFDGSRPSFDSRTARWFYGGQLDWRVNANHTPFIYLLAQEDDNDDGTVDIGGFFPTAFDYNSRYLGIGSKGALSPSWSYSVEGVYQFGDTLSNSFIDGGVPVQQTRDDISAFAAIASLTYLFRDDRDTRLDFDIIAGSGDDDRLDASNTFGGNAPNTKDNAFNSLGFVNTGLALAPTVSNLLTLHAGISSSLLVNRTTRRGDLRAGADLFIFNKLDKDAPISVATDDSHYVGFEVDFFVDWRIFSDLFATVRYGAFFPGAAIPGDQDKRRDFVYIGVTYAF